MVFFFFVFWVLASLDTTLVGFFGIAFVDQPTVVPFGTPSSFIRLILLFVPRDHLSPLGSTHLWFFQGFDQITCDFIPLFHVDEPRYAFSLLGSSSFCPSSSSGGHGSKSVGLGGSGFLWIQYSLGLKGRGHPST